MAGKGGKGLITTKTTTTAANKDKKKSISRSSRAGIQQSYTELSSHRFKEDYINHIPLPHK
ncbi:unnamed protein product, partial [Brassica rapa subsp. narinosa]